MPNGAHGDHPVSDTVVHGRHPYPPELEALVIELHRRDPGVFGALERAPFEWAAGRHVPQAIRLLRGLVEHHGDHAARRRLIREYVEATSPRG